MNIEESKNQIETLIEAWQLDEADLNQTDINAMQVLLKENQELKKQYEKVLNDYCRLDAYNKTQQKEFIKYLEDEIFKNTPTARWKHYDEDGSCDYTIENCNCVRIQPVNETLKETLQKYKSIIGVSDDKTN